MNTPAYFPKTPPAQLAWAEHFINTLEPRAGKLPGITWPVVQQLRAALDLLAEADDYAARAADLAARRDADRHAAAWSDPAAPHKIMPSPPVTGPVSARTVTGGLYPLLFNCADNLINSPACTADLKTALQLNPIKTES